MLFRSYSTPGVYCTSRHASRDENTHRRQHLKKYDSLLTPSCFCVLIFKQDVNSATPDRSLATAPWLSSCASTPPPAELLCSTCSSSAPSPGPQGPQHPQTPRHAQTTPRRAPPYLKDPWGQYLTLHYSTQHEERVVAEIVAMAGAGEERPSLSVAFLLCLCLQYSAARLHTSDLRRLLLLTASQVQNAMWVSFCEGVGGWVGGWVCEGECMLRGGACLSLRMIFLVDLLAVLSRQEHTKELAAGQSEG